MQQQTLASSSTSSGISLAAAATNSSNQRGQSPQQLPFNISNSSGSAAGSVHSSSSSSLRALTTFLQGLLRQMLQLLPSCKTTSALLLPGPLHVLLLNTMILMTLML
jgi:hypothetical protein